MLRAQQLGETWKSLELTPIGRVLTAIEEKVGLPDFVWSKASETFAKNAVKYSTGIVTKVGYFEGRTWLAVEKGILKAGRITIRYLK